MTALQEIFVNFQNSAMPMELTALAASVALAWMCAWALGRGAFWYSRWLAKLFW